MKLHIWEFPSMPKNPRTSIGKIKDDQQLQTDFTLMLTHFTTKWYFLFSTCIYNS